MGSRLRIAIRTIAVLCVVVGIGLLVLKYRGTERVERFETTTPPAQVEATAEAEAKADLSSMKKKKVRFLDQDKVFFYQGYGMPSSQPLGPGPFSYDDKDGARKPFVDGRQGSPQSMAMFSYNKCAPECCPSPYSCDRGCVCLTDEQKELLVGRGANGWIRDGHVPCGLPPK